MWRDTSWENEVERQIFRSFDAWISGNIQGDVNTIK